MDGIPSSSGTLLKDSITKNYQELCDAIDCSDNFLTRLYTNDIITQGLMSEVKSLHDNTTKASKILDFLKDCRTDADFSKFVDILKTSGYSRAVDIITEPITLPSSTTSHGYQGVVAGYIERQKLKQEALQHLTTEPNRDTQITFLVVVLHGFGGNGKSQMARKLVQILTKEANDSENITKYSSLWINAVSEGSVIEGFRNFANIAKDENVLGLMKKLYQEWKDRNLLLVFDDGDDFEMLKKFLPLDETETNVRVIITAHSEWVCGDQNVKNIPVSNFTVTEFKNFVAKAVSCSISEEDSKQLEGHTGRVPAILSLVCKGFSQRFKRDSSYTIAKHFAKYGTEIFTFGEDGKLVPGLKESDYKKSAKIAAQQQLACMENWDYDSHQLMNLAKFILNRIAYCDPNRISEEYFFMVHPQILRKANEDYSEIRQAIGILKEFGWVELLEEENDKTDDDESYDDEELNLQYSKIYSMHACYQIGLKSQLDEKASKSILHGMIQYIQAGSGGTWERYRHLAAFWSCICIHSKRSSLVNHVIKTYHCLIGLAENGLINEFKSLSSAYTDKTQLVHALLKDEDLSPSSPMYDIFRNAYNHECVNYIILEIKAYYDHLEDSDEKAWIRHQLLWAATGVMYLKQSYDNIVFTLDTFNLNVNEGLGEEGSTLLHSAASAGNSEFVRLLIEKGANINEKDVNGQTPFYRACFLGKSKFVQLLIEKGANINEKDVNGITPLYMACMFGNSEFVRTLIEKGVSINEKDVNGRTILHTVCLLGKLEFAQLLVEKGANVNEKDVNGITPLHCAAWIGNQETVKFLIEHGANIHEKHDGGGTALHTAVFMSNLEVVKLLIEKGANVDEKDVCGQTPLHITVQGEEEEEEEEEEEVQEEAEDNEEVEEDDDLEIVKFLVENGANIYEVNGNGDTPLQLALKSKRQDIVDYFTHINQSLHG